MPDDMNTADDSAFVVAEPREVPLSDSAALAQLRSYIANQAFKPGQKLPAERALCTELGLRRNDLRKALETLERENRLWRHVGKGTFLTATTTPDQTSGLDRLAQQVSPADVMRARSALEPAIAREAALHATAAAIAKLHLNLDRARKAATWREYEALDNEFHRQIAEATGSTTLLALFDQLNTLRRMVSWGRIQRTSVKPPVDHPSFTDHSRIVAEVAARSPDAAQSAMRAHLRAVEIRLFS